MAERTRAALAKRFLGLDRLGAADVFGQVFDSHQAVLADYGGVLDDVFQFPNVTGIVVFHEQGQGFRGGPLDFLSIEVVVFGNEMFD